MPLLVIICFYQKKDCRQSVRPGEHFLPLISIQANMFGGTHLEIILISLQRVCIRDLRIMAAQSSQKEDCYSLQEQEMVICVPSINAPANYCGNPNYLQPRLQLRQHMRSMENSM